MIFDTHSHCYWKTLLPRIDEILENMKKNNVTKALQIGCDINTSQQAILLAKKYENIFYASVGFHPVEANSMNWWREIFETNFQENSNDFETFLEKISLFSEEKWEKIFEKIPELLQLQNLILENRKYIVAIGETGLDFHYLDGTDDGKAPFDRENASKKAKIQIENQKFFWLAQWKLAQKFSLPVIIHSRDARIETKNFMKIFGISYAVMHSYAEDTDTAKELLHFSENIYFSFSGILTYKNAREVQETAKMLPIKKILVETDAPFLSPQCVRGQKCEPAFTRFTLEKLAEIRWEKTEDLEKIIYENSLRFYQITE